MGHTAKVGHDHAKAVVERHRDDQPVALIEVHAFGDEIAIVEDVVVRQRGAFGSTGSAGGKLDVDGVIKL